MSTLNLPTGTTLTVTSTGVIETLPAGWTGNLTPPAPAPVVPSFVFGINIGSLGSDNTGIETNVTRMLSLLGAIAPFAQIFRGWFDSAFAAPAATITNALVSAGKKVLAVINFGNNLASPVSTPAEIATVIASTIAAVKAYLAACPGVFGIEFGNECDSATYFWQGSNSIQLYVQMAIQVSAVVHAAGKKFVCANPTSGLTWLQEVAAECIAQGTTIAKVFDDVGCHFYVATPAAKKPLDDQAAAWAATQGVGYFPTEYQLHELGNGAMPTSLTAAQATQWGGDSGQIIADAKARGGTYGYFSLTQNFIQHAGPCGILLPNGLPNQPFFNDVLAALQAVKAAA